MTLNQKSRHIRSIFFQVKSDQMKRDKLVETAQEYFEKKEPLLFKVPHSQAEDYLDGLLWRWPKHSFLPHVVQNLDCTDLIVITASNNNPNCARALFNLTKEPVDNPEFFFTHIYEFDDLSSTFKNKTALNHYQTYKERGYTIITLWVYIFFFKSFQLFLF